ncbi:MAG: hypothetical protein ACRCU1_00405 [Alsobacter sp.]
MSEPQTRHVQDRKRGTAGWVVRPSPALRWATPGDMHLERAAWLASTCEGAPGVVQGWDGAGASIGPLHTPLALPSARCQGRAAWLLVAQLLATGGPSSYALARLIARVDWRIVDGVVVDRLGREVAWTTIRDEVGGPGGVTVQGTPDADRALQWCRALSEATAPPATHHAQLASARDWLAGGQAAAEAPWYALSGGIRRASVASLGGELDCALGAYHALATHAPGWAVRALLAAERGQARSLGAALRAEAQRHEAWRVRRWPTVRRMAAQVWAPDVIARVLPA